MTEGGAGGVGLNSSDNDKVSLRSCPEHRRQSLKMLIGLEGAHALDPHDLLITYPLKPMTMWPISTRVNRPEK